MLSLGLLRPRARGAASTQRFAFAAQSWRARSRWLCDRGSIAVKFALLTPLLLAMTGGTLDYGLLLRERAKLQTAADAAAKAAALEFTVIDTTKFDVTLMTQAMVRSMMSANADSPMIQSLRVFARAKNDPQTVTVDASMVFKGPFGVFDRFLAPITVRSVAQIVGKLSVCVVALDREVDGAIELLNQARLTAQNCGVYSNSSHSAGIRSKNSAVLSSTLTCSVGGKDGIKGNFTPDPLTDCPVFEDPFASRPAPAVGACTAKNTKLLSGTHTLSPGVYCGGLIIGGTAQVTLAPGVYIVKDGPLRINDSAVVSGTGVGFYLTGLDARIKFDTDTTISLSAPETGEMAGMLFQEDRNQTISNQHVINSDNARVLLGTIYLPVGELKIDAKRPVADQSAYTAIVARVLRLYSGPNLVLNTNYDQTSVPVPEGIKGVGQPIALVQ